MSNEKLIEEFISGFCITSQNKNSLYNILTPIILSKKFLKNRKEKKEFVENVLELKLAEYAYNSKTILLGKIISEIEGAEVDRAFHMNEKVENFLIELIKANKEVDDGKTNNRKVKKSSKSFFSNWNEYINSSNKNSNVD